VGGPFVRSVQPRGKTLIIDSNSEMETRHPVGGPLSREFSAIVIIAEL